MKQEDRLNSSSHTPKARADFALVIVCLIWGATFIIVKKAVADIPILLFLAIRFSIAAFVLALIFGLRKNRPSFRGSVRAGLIAGIFLFSGYLFQTYGLARTTASKTGFITGLYIPMVPLLSALLYRKMPTLTEGLGVMMAFAGTALMTIQKDLLSVNVGDLLVAVAAVCYAFHIIVVGRFSKTVDVGWLSAGQIAAAAGLSWLAWFAAPSGATTIRWTSTVWVALGVTSLLCTAFGFTVQAWAQKHTTATRTALIFSLEPIFAWMASYVAAGEVLSPRAVLGAALILAGILYVELKPRAAPNHMHATTEPPCVSMRNTQPD